MKKASGGKLNFENNIKKGIIKRINESVYNKNIKTIETYRNKKTNLHLNNNVNSFLKTNPIKDLSLKNNNIMYNNNTNNIFLKNNSSFMNNKKTRNKITFELNKDQDLLNGKKTIEINNFKNIFANYLNNKKNKNNKSYNDLNYYKSHNQSCDEEIIRKYYLNSNNNNFNNISNKIYFKHMNKVKTKRTYNNLDTENSKNNNDSIYTYRNKNIKKIKYFQTYNTGNLSTKYLSSYENTNFQNSIKTSNINAPIKSNLSHRNNKLSLAYTYKKVNLSLSNKQRIKNQIESYENKINNSTININTQNQEGAKLLIKRRITSKIYKKHYASKSQENIKENRNNYNILKKVNYYEYYKKKMKFIIKIQKWWKDMIFHMYIEPKIIFIQKYYKNFLIKQKNKIKIQLNYVYNINKIILIQKKWKKIIKLRKRKSSSVSSEKILPKSIPFKLDNFDIMDFTDSNDSKNNEQNNINIYWKKSVNKYKRKTFKNNTVSNFYEPKKNKLMIQNQINFDLISLKNKTNNISKYILSKNISFEINCLSENKIHNIYHPPIKSKMYIEKEYKIKNNKEIIYNRNKAINLYINNNYISKIRINKNIIFDSIKLLQKNIKKYLYKIKYQYIIKPISKYNYFSKIRKISNILDLSSNNKIENLSFKGNYFTVNSNSNRDKISESDISNEKSEKNSFFQEKQKIGINYKNNLFNFENNSNNKNNNKESLQTLLLKEKLKNLINKYFYFNFNKNLKLVLKIFIISKFVIIINKYIIKKKRKIIFNALKAQNISIKNKNKNRDEDIFDEDDITNIINRIRTNKNNPSSNLLILKPKKFKNTSAPKEYYINDEDGLANYILNFFYNEKKFTNINIKLIKERLSKSPLIYRTKTNIIKYINNLHKDIIQNKICHACFCKFEEKCDDNCCCHINNNLIINNKKGGISIYRQKMNKIIKNMNEEKINIKTVKNMENNKINDFNIFKGFNNKNFENGINDDNKNNSTINRYDTDSIHSKSRSVSKE